MKCRNRNRTIIYKTAYDSSHADIIYINVLFKAFEGSSVHYQLKINSNFREPLSSS